MIDDKSIKERIRAAREKTGLSQKETARRMGFNRNAYWSFEKGATQIISARLRTFTETVGCSLEYLLLGYEPQHPDQNLLREADNHREYLRTLTEDYEKRLENINATLQDKEALIASLERTVKVQQDMILMLQK